MVHSRLHKTDYFVVCQHVKGRLAKPSICPASLIALCCCTQMCVFTKFLTCCLCCQTLLSKVPGDEVISWLHMSLFYCSQNCTDSVNGTPVFDFLRTDLMSPMTSPTTPRRSSMASRSRPEDMTRDSWLKLLRLAQSVGLYLRWSIPPELCNSTL